MRQVDCIASRRRGAARTPAAHQQGYVLVTVIVFAFMLAAIAFLLSHETSMGNNLATRDAERDEVRYVAEAAMRHARWDADRSACTAYGVPDTPFGDHSYSAQFSPTSGSPVSIAATGVLTNGASYTMTTGATIYEPPTKTILQPDGASMADTYLDKDASSDNHGNNTALRVASDDVQHALLRFDLPDIPAEARLVSASLELKARVISDGGQVAVHRVTTGWAEGTEVSGPGSGATWLNRDSGEPWSAGGGDYDAAAVATTMVSGANNQWHQWDITAPVDGWLAGTLTNNGLIILPASGTVELSFESSDSAVPADRPRLILTYACECGWGGATDNLVLQPGPAAGKDTKLVAAGPSNYGGESILEVHLESGPPSNSLLQFDLSSIPTAAIINSATLSVNAQSVALAGNVSVHAVTTAWTESKATWDDATAATTWSNPGGDFESLAADSQPVTAPGAVVFDVAAIVSAWSQQSLANNGLLLTAQGDVSVEFASSDASNVGSRPILQVDYTCPCGVDCDADSGGSGSFCEADFAATTRVLNFKWEPTHNDLIGIDFLAEGLVVNGETIPVGGGWIMADTGEDALFVTDATGAPLTDFPIDQGNARGVAYVESGPWAGHLAVAEKNDDAIYFLDLDGNTVSSFLTELYVQEPFGLTYVGATENSVYDDHLAFSSAKDDGDIYIVDQAGALKKSIDVAAYAPDPQGVAHLTGFDKFMVIDKTGIVSIIDFDGTLLNQYDTATWGFKSTQGAAIHPVTCDHVFIEKNIKRVSGFNATGTQGGNPNLLMVVADETNLTPQESAKKLLFETWRYFVTVIEAATSDALLDAAAAVNDVVFIGEDISAGDLDDKLADTIKGVVYEEANLTDEFGLADGVGWSSDTSVNIDDVDHYITRPLSIGPLTIANSPIELANITGNQAPALRELASEAAGPMLVALEASAEGLGGLPVAGRRAQLPWAGSNFDINALNSDGQGILRRALEWGTQPPPRCNADFAANNLGSQVAWAPGTADVQGIDFVPGNTVINSVAVPDAGGWILTDKNKDKLFVMDLDGDALTDFDILPNDTYGVAMIDSGQWIHHIAVIDKAAKRIFYLDLDGEISWSFKISDITSGDPFGLAFIGGTASGDYDDHLAFTSDKNASGGGEATVYVIDPAGTLKTTINVETFAPKPQGVTHLPGTDKLLVSDEDGVVSIVDFDGNLVRQYSANMYGVAKIMDVGINPFSCAHALVDSNVENVTLMDRVDPGGTDPAYVGMFLPWYQTALGSWQSKNLGIYGVPPNAVAEIAVINTDGGKEWWGGARAYGSSLDRRLQLHEADGGGMDVMTMHVQTDAAGRIETYTNEIDKVQFVLLGYWTNSTYVETWESFSAGASGSWTTKSVNGYGVAADGVAEVLLVNNDQFNEREAGVRTNGSSTDRRIDLHEALAGGREMASMFVTADSHATARIEVYAEDKNDIDFYLTGYWSTPPGTYNEAFDDIGRPGVKDVWLDKDLSSHGVPANSTAQIAVVNRDPGSKTWLGLRPTDSMFERQLQLHKPLNGGEDLGVMHVTTDTDQTIQWFEDDDEDNHRFYLLGWWD